MNESVVVDASLAVKWLVEEEDSDKATDLARRWDDAGMQLAAPHLLAFEVANALHRRVMRGGFTAEVVAGLMQDFMSLGIVLHHPPNLHIHALNLASQLRQGAAYDAHYLALAEILDCELWTADARFYQAASQVARNVRWLGEAAPSR